MKMQPTVNILFIFWPVMIQLFLKQAYVGQFIVHFLMHTESQLNIHTQINTYTLIMKKYFFPRCINTTRIDVSCSDWKSGEIFKTSRKKSFYESIMLNLENLQ